MKKLIVLMLLLLALAGCGSSAAPVTKECDSDCQYDHYRIQRVVDLQAGMAEKNDEMDHILQTFEVYQKTLSEDQLKAQFDKYLVYQKCVTVEVVKEGAAAVRKCYDQLLASGFGAVK